MAVLSDIHGNLPALQAVMRDMKRHKPDAVVVAGDAVNRGPFSREVLAIIREERWPIVRGNHEQVALDFDTPRMPEWWAAMRLAPRLVAELEAEIPWIAAWPDELCLRFRQAAPLRMVHGVPGNLWKTIYPTTPVEEAAGLLGEPEEDTIIIGHSHLAIDRHIDRWHVINPGSVGCAYHGDGRAYYAILHGDHDGWRAEHHAVGYDQAPLFAEWERIAFLEHMGPWGRLIIEEFRTGRLHRLPLWRWKEEHHPEAEITDELVDAFFAIDPMPYYPETHRGVLVDARPAL
ncbi:MAG: hypothetical protein GYB64_17820 [Chloroflexi bacterium]|nr:hypothetical protein [Chloroflexota bacterium]